MGPSQGPAAPAAPPLPSGPSSTMALMSAVAATLLAVHVHVANADLEPEFLDSDHDSDAPAATAEGAARINAELRGWTAHVPPSPLAAVTNRELRSMCGSPLPKIYAKEELPSWISVMSDEEVSSFDPPASHDGRTAWPHCAPIIGHVRNQGPCGDCWAFGGTQMMQDRFCIATGNNASSQLLSTEDVIACMDLFIGTPGQGCGGGAPMSEPDGPSSSLPFPCRLLPFHCRLLPFLAVPQPA